MSKPQNVIISTNLAFSAEIIEAVISVTSRAAGWDYIEDELVGGSHAQHQP